MTESERRAFAAYLEQINISSYRISLILKWIERLAQPVENKANKVVTIDEGRKVAAGVKGKKRERLIV